MRVGILFLSMLLTLGCDDLATKFGEPSPDDPIGTPTTYTCDPGTWDHDGSPYSPCRTWSRCSFGEGSLGGSTTEDVTCVECAAGSRSEGGGPCIPKNICAPGQFVIVDEPNRRECAPCIGNTYTDEINQHVCVTGSDCMPGYQPVIAPNHDHDVTCEPCAAGTFCDGSNKESACNLFSWDHDLDPATPCELHTICEFDDRVVSEPTAFADRICTGCAPGLVNFEHNSDACVEPCDYGFSITCDQFDQGYLKASNAEAGDLFGHSVGLDGDTLVVGAPGEASEATGINGDQNNNDEPASGAAYVFVRENGVWVQQAYLKASNAQSGDRFGHAVAISGNRIVVGAPGEDSNARGSNREQFSDQSPDSGAIYVFERIGVTWTQKTYLKPENTSEDQAFGSVIALADDTMVVGAPGDRRIRGGIDNPNDNTGANPTGAAYIFEETNSKWTQMADLKPDGVLTNTEFGRAIAIDGDFVAVSDTRDRTQKPSSGAIWRYSRESGTWLFDSVLYGKSPLVGDRMGQSIAMRGDRILTGALGTLKTGAVRTFIKRSGAFYERDDKIIAPNVDPYDLFGNAVILLEERAFIASKGEESSGRGIGADMADNSMDSSGAVYGYTLLRDNWEPTAYIKAPNTDEGDQFGFSIAISGNLMAIAAPYEDSIATGIDGYMFDNSALDSGAVYIRKIAPD